MKLLYSADGKRSKSKNTSLHPSYLPILVILLLNIGCSTAYEKGENFFEQGDYASARREYLAIELGDENYNAAQIKLTQIRAFLDKQILDSALSFYSSKKYVDAENILSAISDSSTYHFYSVMLLRRMDSIRKANREHNKKIANAKSNGKNQNAGGVDADDNNGIDDPQLNNLRKQVKVLFEELLEFKNRSDFQSYGFGMGYKYNKWLKEVKALKSSPLNIDLLSMHGFVVGDLETLGIEYSQTNGKDNEYTIWAKNRIRAGLKDGL
jgi:hypothetical protein